MSGEELQNAIRAFERRRPFRPYYIDLSNGDRIHISHPETLERYAELFYHRSADGTHRVFAAAHVCQLIDERSS
jgi:hypothetical protein